MVQLTFANAIRRHVDCPDAVVDGNTLRCVLDAYFERYPLVRGYVLDDRNAVRRHVAVFLDNTLIIDRDSLADPVRTDSTVHVFQALSGGAA